MNVSTSVPKNFLFAVNSFVDIAFSKDTTDSLPESAWTGFVCAFSFWGVLGCGLLLTRSPLAILFAFSLRSRYLSSSSWSTNVRTLSVLKDCIGLRTLQFLRACPSMSVCSSRASFRSLCWMQPYMAQNSNECKGIAYIECGATETEHDSPSGYTVWHAPPHSDKDNRQSYPVFKEGPRTTKAKFIGRTYKVHNYTPRPHICYKCHIIRHKANVYPSHTRKCNECGNAHEEDMECTHLPKSFKCGGNHPANNRACQKGQYHPRQSGTHPLWGLLRTDFFKYRIALGLLLTLPDSTC